PAPAEPAVTKPAPAPGQSLLHWGRDRINQRALPLDGRPLPTGLGQGVHVYVLDTGASPEGIRIARLPEHSGDFVGDAWGKQHGSADCHGHGSHVAGIVAGTEAGVASGATLYALRVTDCEGRRSEEHTSELQSRENLVCRLLL